MNDARPFAPEELSEHFDFLRRLARGLLRDEHLAEDVAQEALVAALEHPPRERGALRAWLARTARNLALNRRTSDVRRTRREETSARPEADAQGEALERLELQRVVFEHVLALDEPKRAALFLRYHEGLEPAAIAARLGVPVKTVKTRLARGLAELRERLEPRFGDRRALGLALLRLAEAPGLGIAAKVAAGGIAVKVLLGAAAAVALWLTWQVRQQEPGEPGERADRGDRVVAYTQDRYGNPGVLRESDLAARESVAKEVPAKRARFTVTGTVRVRGDGAPLASAAIEAQVHDPFERFTTATDAAGRYELEFDRPVTVSTVTVAATATTTATRLSLGKRLGAAEPLVADLWVTCGARLAARAVDTRGNPVAGATVRAWCDERFDPSKAADRRATTSASGAFVIEHLGESFVLDAEKPGLACLHGLRGVLAPGNDVEGLEVVVDEAAFLRGHVVDEDGRPIEGVELADQPHMESSTADATGVAGVQRFYAHDVRTLTGPDGAFALGPVARRTWNARVTHPGFLLADHLLDPENEDNRVVLRAGHRLRGTVFGADGAPLAGAKVHVRPERGEERSTTTDSTGMFEVRALHESDDAFVLVAAPEHALLARQPVVIGPGAPAHLDLHLERPSPLAGRVLDGAGRPIADALVRAEGDRLLEYEDVDFGERTTWEWKAGCNETRTDEEGRFRFAQLYRGTFRLLASAPDAPGLVVEVSTASGRVDVEIALDRERIERVAFAASVRDGRTGAVLPRFTVSAMREGPEPGSLRGNPRSFEEDARGRFRLDDLPPGRYQLRVSSPGFATWKEELREYRGGEHSFDVVLWPLRGVRFAAVDERGRPLPLTVRLTFHDLDGRRLEVDHGTWASNTAHVGQDGVAISGLPARLVRVTASATGYLDTTLDLDLGVPQPEPVVIELNEDPRDATVRCNLVLLETDDPALAQSEDAALLREAYLAGRATALARPAEIEFLDEEGHTVARATLERGERRAIGVRFSRGLAGESFELDGPEIPLDLPQRAVEARIRVAGCAERHLPLDLQLGRDNTRAAAVLVDER